MGQTLSQKNELILICSNKEDKAVEEVLIKRLSNSSIEDVYSFKEELLQKAAVIIVIIPTNESQSSILFNRLKLIRRTKKAVIGILMPERSNAIISNYRPYIDYLASSSLYSNELESLLSLLAPFLNISHEVPISQGSSPTYKRALQEVKSRPLHETKLIVVGQGSVGKTSLVNRIIHNTFNPNEMKTEGIKISRYNIEVVDNRDLQIEESDEKPPWWKLYIWTIIGFFRKIPPISQRNRSSRTTLPKPYRDIVNIEDDLAILPNANTIKIRLNIWDFGGQEILHATHQFFLTGRSLYLLVIDSLRTQEANQLEYWLKVIKSFGKESPVLIAGNKVDQQPLDIDQTSLRRKYPNIVSITPTSAATGKGIYELQFAISQQVAKLSYIRDLVPEPWFQVKEKLENLDRDFISYSEYEALCKEVCINDEASQSTLISFLHDLGSVLNFRDDPRLQETNILNPEWITNGVYRILNSNELFQKKGVLETKQLGQILDPKTYPRTRHMFIVDMMRKFEICYPFEGEEGKYLIPDLLPRSEPFTGVWDDALAFEFHYGVLPGSIISRFIVRMHPFIHQHTVWRTGVVLKSGNNLALVKADYEDKIIVIRVTGERETRRDVLAMIRGTLDAIHKTITGLETMPKVPHPDYPKLILDYEELIEFEKQGINSFPRKVGPQVVIVDVKHLLDGVEDKSAPQVFISYAHTDKAYANKIAKSLKAAGLGVWKDTSSLQGGAAWLQEIARGISQSKLVLNLLSQNSIESGFVEKELIYALDTAKKKVIPLRIKDVQPPLMLANLQYVDFYRKNYEKTFDDLLDLIRDNL